MREEEKTEALEFLSESIKFKSINPPGNEKGFTEFIEKILIENNLGYKKIEIEKDRYSLIITLEGEDNENPVLFTGHMDVVSVGEEELKKWNTNPFEPVIKDNFLYGRGSSDMKSGLIAALYSMILLKRENITPKNTIIFAATIDEENMMKGSKKLVGLGEIKKCKNCIVCEPTGLKLATKCKGRTFANIFVTGKSAHGSMTTVGSNAIYNCLEFMQKIIDEKIDLWNLASDFTFWRVLAIHANKEPQVVPDICTMTLDARISTKDNTNRIYEVLDRIIDETTKDKDFKITYDIIDRREPIITNDEENIVKVLKNVIEKNNVEFKKFIFQGSTDGAIFRKNEMKTVIFGPGDLSCVHKENERVDLGEFYKAIDIYKDIIMEKF